MKKSKAKLITVINITFILLIITCSFAWIVDFQTIVAKTAGFFFGTANNNELIVAPDGLQIELFVADKDDVYTELSTANNNKIKENLAPGSVVKYAIRIKNITKAEIKCQVTMADIEAPVKLMNEVYVGLFSALGFEKVEQEPKLIEFNLKEQVKIDYANNKNQLNKDLPQTVAADVTDAELEGKKLSALFINGFTVPVNEKGVEIRYYVRIANTATNIGDDDIQHLALKLGNLNFMIL